VDPVLDSLLLRKTTILIPLFVFRSFTGVRHTEISIIVLKFLALRSLAPSYIRTLESCKKNCKVSQTRMSVSALIRPQNLVISLIRLLFIAMIQELTERANFVITIIPHSFGDYILSPALVYPNT
jgi:hypothetical protein